MTTSPVETDIEPTADQRHRRSAETRHRFHRTESTEREPRRSFRGPPLRARIIALFTFGGLLLSALLATTTYGFARENLVRQRERNAVEQATANAIIVQASLSGDETEVAEEATGDLVTTVLDALSSQAGGVPLLNVAEQWRGGGTVVPQDIPESLRDRVIVDTTPSRMFYQVDGQPYLAVGLPLPRGGVSYFEVTDLDELESNLRTLALILLIGGAFTTVSGAIFGIWAARQVLQPIDGISQAATAIAAGALDTRLEVEDDPDLERLVASFNGMAGALQDRLDRDARFASDVSHELRSPLMTLRASIGVLEGRQDELSERSRAALDLLVTELDRFERLITDLLEISRIDSGSVTDSADVVDAVGIVRAAVEHHGTTVPIVADPDLADARIAVDKRRLAQVITNLLDNAEHYAGGATRVAILRDGAEIRIIIEDEGPGIPEEEREHVFARFARGTTASRRGFGGGTGLGLALVREHVRLHGGRVWVEDRPDDRAGSRFVVALPEFS